LRGIRGGLRNPYAKTHWTRQQVAHYLGVANGTVRTYERKFLLPYVCDEFEQRWFNPDDVRSLGTRLAQNRAGSANHTITEGDLHAYIFSRFRREASIADIVLETQQPVQTIRRLWDEYNHELGDLPTKELSEKDRLLLEKKRLENKRLRLRLQREEERAAERVHEKRMHEIESEARAIRKDREAREEKKEVKE